MRKIIDLETEGKKHSIADFQPNVLYEIHMVISSISVGETTRKYCSARYRPEHRKQNTYIIQYSIINYE